jgi:hypothetical protein
MIEKNFLIVVYQTAENQKHPLGTKSRKQVHHAAAQIFASLKPTNFVQKNNLKELHYIFSPANMFFSLCKIK